MAVRGGNRSKNLTPRCRTRSKQKTYRNRTLSNPEIACGKHLRVPHPCPSAFWRDSVGSTQCDGFSRLLPARPQVPPGTCTHPAHGKQMARLRRIFLDVTP